MEARNVTVYPRSRLPDAHSPPRSTGPGGATNMSVGATSRQRLAPFLSGRLPTLPGLEKTSNQRHREGPRQAEWEKGGTTVVLVFVTVMSGRR
ncbi:hypothetical protein E2C01_018738 [Portunus trituberculatus]|uniref:Uncharacterized protein n=1 Tax=Portunus trituberculatus TaxID=210409 RepID=A0A5B7DW31_PORTR|nr:hypothetical protein [Portunus trituberculatus]